MRPRASRSAGAGTPAVQRGAMRSAMIGAPGRSGSEDGFERLPGMDPFPRGENDPLFPARGCFLVARLKGMAPRGSPRRERAAIALAHLCGRLFRPHGLQRVM